jgi:signal transduction histidine kinase
VSKVFKYVQRQNLFTTLLTVVFLLAGLSIFSSVIGWKLLKDMQIAQVQLSRVNLPLVSVAHSMATQSANLALIAPQLIRIEDHESLGNSYRKIERNLNLMDSIPSRIRSLSGRYSSYSQINSVVLEIRQLFGNMHHALNRNLSNQLHRGQARDQFREKIKAMRSLIDAAIASQADRVIDQLDSFQQSGQSTFGRQTIEEIVALNFDNEVLFNLERRLTVLDGLAEFIDSNQTGESLRNAKSTIDFQIRIMVSDTTSLSSSAMQGSLGVSLSELYDLLASPDNLLVQQQKNITSLLELKEFDADLQESVFQLNSLTAALVTGVEEDTANQSRVAVDAAQFGTNILLGIVFLSLVVSTISIWVFIVRRIIWPLKELAVAMRSISRNESTIEILSYSMLELNEISIALRVFRDNSLALAQHQKSLQQSNAQLSRANQDLNTFVHVASHDLKSPLRNMRVLTDFIADEIKQGKLDEATDNLILLQQRITRLSILLDSLLKYTLADAPAGAVGRVNVRRLIKETFAMAEGHENFTLKLPVDLPICRAIESDLSSVFLSLITNAINHHDQKTGEIEIRFNEDRENYIFEVSDDGPGIDPEYHEQIFEILKTLKSRDEVEGSGVGLAHAKRLLESRGGSINVTSNPAFERGSRFVFYYYKPRAKSNV